MVHAEVVVMAMQAVLSVAATAGAGATTTDSALAVMIVSSTQHHSAPSRHIKRMLQWLSFMHPSGAFGTLGKLGTPDSLHYTVPGMIVSTKGTSKPAVPR